MSKCDEIRELYNHHGEHNICSIFNYSLGIVKAKIDRGERPKTVNINCEDIEKALKITSIYPYIPQLKEKFENEGFTFEYSSAINMYDESYITIGGWAD